RGPPGPRLVRQPHMQRAPVGVGVDSDRGNVHLPTGANHPDGNLSPVGDEYFPDGSHQGVPAALARGSRTDMKTRRGQWKAAGLLLGAAVLGGAPVWAQNFTTGGSSSTSSGSGSSTGGSVTLNNAPNFDPAAAAAAALVGNYRVPGARPVEPVGVYRVPIPDTSGGSAGGPAANPTTATRTRAAGASRAGTPADHGRGSPPAPQSHHPLR